MFKKMFVFTALTASAVIMTGCAGLAPNQEEAAQEKVSEARETPRPEVKKEKSSPCKTLITEALQTSAKSNRTERRKCNDLTIEVNPMWDMNSKGSFHIRVFDAQDKIVQDEIKTP